MRLGVLIYKNAIWDTSKRHECSMGVIVACFHRLIHSEGSSQMRNTGREWTKEKVDLRRWEGRRRFKMETFMHMGYIAASHIYSSVHIYALNLSLSSPTFGDHSPRKRIDGFVSLAPFTS